MLVLKFGGSSVANATAMSRALDIVEEASSGGNVIVVSSAISGCTDKLIDTGSKAAAGDPGFEENIEFLRRRHFGIINRLFTGDQAAEAVKATEELLSELADLARNIYRKGAISEEQKAHIQTFGELLSTKIIAAKLSCEGYSTCWVDSRDIFTVKSGKLDVPEAYSRIETVVKEKSGYRIMVAPGFIARDEQGRPTTLGRGGSDYTAALFAAGSKADGLQIWTDVPGIMTTNPKVVPAARTIPRISYEAALCMAEHGAKVLYAPTVAPAMQAGIAIKILNTFDPSNPGTTIENIPPRDVCEWMGISNIAEGGNERICLTAQGPIETKSTLSRIASCLREAGIVPVESGEDEGYVWVDVRPDVMKISCRAIHKEFFEEEKQNVLEVYIAGCGAVGSALESLIHSGAALRNGKQICLVAISSDHSFVDYVLSKARRHSVFVDCTDSDTISKDYVKLLEAGINVVSSNRHALAVPYVEFAAMRQSALRNGCFFRYNTTVGNALPVLVSVSGKASGDTLVSIEAVVSCALNHIITGYDGANTASFATLLQNAQDAGLTEMDPRMDLAGRDALRKLLIMAREAGISLEEDDVKITPMLSDEYFNCSLEEFYSKLQKAEPEFIEHEAELDAIGKRQRFVASLKRDKSTPLGYRAEIKMQLFGPESPFYWISGTENVIQISTKFSSPLVIKGAGEGAEAAATGILNDILR